MRTGFEVHACTASSPHVRKKNPFHKLIRVIGIFMRKSFVVQCHPLRIDDTSTKISIPILYVLHLYSYLGIKYFFLRIEISIPVIM